jgi:hypothetical protein
VLEQDAVLEDAVLELDSFAMRFSSDDQYEQASCMIAAAVNPVVPLLVLPDQMNRPLATFTAELPM